MQHTDATQFARDLHDRCLGTRVARLHRLVARRFEQALEPCDLSLPQLEVLAGLAVSEVPVSPSDLAAALAVERSTMSRNLKVLQRRELVEVVRRSAGRRVMSVGLTEGGYAALEGARVAWAEAQASVRAALGPGSQAELDAWLGVLASSP